MTIGVVDECRRDGLGTKLLEYTELIVSKQYPTCEIIYLHVVDYNDAAIKFYNKNSFMTSRTIKDHYVIKGK